MRPPDPPAGVFVPRVAGRPHSRLWMVTFADLAALTLAFFVLLFSMSTLDAGAWSRIAGSASQDQDPRSTGAEPVAARNVPAVEADRGHDLDYLAALLAGQIAAEQGLAGAMLERGADHIVIALPAGLLFEPDSAEPHTAAEPALFALAGILRNLPNRIAVEGHTDPAAPDPARFASNWDLSLRRALAVAAGLERAGYTRPVVVRGYGASRFADLSPRLDRRTRFALARRVDVVLHKAIGHKAMEHKAMEDRS